MPEIGNLVTIKITTNGVLCCITGSVESVGLIPKKPDAWWIQLVGLSAWFYSDDVNVEIKVID